MKELANKIRKLSSDLKRQIASGYEYEVESGKKLSSCLNDFRIALDNLLKGASTFLQLDSRRISSDGKLGGRGNICLISDIRKNLLTASDTVSGIIDTIEDELSARHWSHLRETTLLEENSDPILEEVDISQLSPDFGDEVVQKDEEIVEEIQPIESPEQPEKQIEEHTPEIPEESKEEIEPKEEIKEEETGNNPEEEIIDQGQIKDIEDEEEMEEEPEEQ